MQVDQLDLRDLYRAVGYKPKDTPEENRYFVQLMSDSLGSYKTLIEAMFSDQAPATIVQIAERMGMIIPGNLRIGLKAYHYFLDNFRFYHRVNLQLKTIATVHQVEQASDGLLRDFLGGLEDTRPKSVTLAKQKFSQGFHMISCDFKLTLRANCVVIKHVESNKTVLYTLYKLRALIDKTTQTLWKVYNKERFSDDQVLGLRQIMVEQLGLWTRSKQLVSLSNQFCKLLLDLDSILVKYNLVPWQDYIDNSFLMN